MRAIPPASRVDMEETRTKTLDAVERRPRRSPDIRGDVGRGAGASARMLLGRVHKARGTRRRPREPVPQPRGVNKTPAGL